MKILCENIKKNKFAILAMVLFICHVLLNKYLYMFNMDELHAYAIAKRFGFVDIIRLMRAEGHTFIWYLLLKLIPNKHYFFPYGLKFLSVLFSFISMYFLWFKSTFGNLEKCVITISFPMLYMYPTLARPYSIGVMFLFILAFLYPKRLIYPIWYAVLIFLTANTSLMAAVGAFTFSLIFLHDLIKTQNKMLLPSVLILIFTALSLIIQWYNPIIPQYKMHGSLNGFFFHWYKERIFSVLSYYIIPFFVLVSTWYLRKDFRSLFFFWSNSIILALFFLLIYNGAEYHYYFIYVYWVISYWLAGYKCSLKNNKLVFISFLILNLLFFTCIRKHHFWYIPYKKYTDYIEELAKHIPEGSSVYAVSGIGQTIYYIYADKFKCDFKTYDNNSFFSFDSYLNIYNFTSFNDSIEDVIKKAAPNSYLLVDIYDDRFWNKNNNRQVFANFTKEHEWISVEHFWSTKSILCKIR